MPAKILFTNTSAEIVEDACDMSPAGLELIVAAPGIADSVVLAPHLAGSGRETRVKQTRNAFDNVLRVDRGERPLWLAPELHDMATI